MLSVNPQASSSKASLICVCLSLVDFCEFLHNFAKHILRLSLFFDNRFSQKLFYYINIRK